MAQKEIPQKAVREDSQKRATLKAVAPKLGEAGEYHRQNVEGILRRNESLDSAKELLGWDIIAATPEGLKRVRIAKTRSFNGISRRTTNKDSIYQEAGHVYIMHHRAAKFLNITTGREGKPTCVWIEEAIDLSTGKVVKNNQLLKLLDLMESDGKPIFSNKTAIIPGQTPQEIVRVSPSAGGASENTTGIFRAIFSEDQAAAHKLGEAVDLYTRQD